MKKVMQKLLILGAFLGLISACSKDKDDPSPTNSAIFMRAMVDGKSFDVSGQGSSGNQQGVSCMFQKSNQTLDLLPFSGQKPR